MPGLVPSYHLVNVPDENGLEEGLLLSLHLASPETPVFLPYLFLYPSASLYPSFLFGLQGQGPWQRTNAQSSSFLVVSPRWPLS